MGERGLIFGGHTFDMSSPFRLAMQDYHAAVAGTLSPPVTAPTENANPFTSTPARPSRPQAPSTAPPTPLPFTPFPTPLPSPSPLPSPVPLPEVGAGTVSLSLDPATRTWVPAGAFAVPETLPVPEGFTAPRPGGLQILRRPFEPLHGRPTPSPRSPPMSERSESEESFAVFRGRRNRAGNRRRVRRRNEVWDGVAVPSDMTENLDDEALVAVASEALRRDRGVEVSTAASTHGGIRRAEGAVLQDLRAAEDRKAAAEEGLKLVRNPSAVRLDQCAVRAGPALAEEVRACTELIEGAEARAAAAFKRAAEAEQQAIAGLWTQFLLIRKTMRGGAPAAACGICLSGPMAQAALPCGHVLCRGCMQRMTRPTLDNAGCWVCRRPVDQVLDLYFP